jgi:hypothetical protein
MNGHVGNGGASHLAPETNEMGESDMRHFSSEQWVDFVRNTLGDKDKVAMDAHLETGCKPCSVALNKWVRVREAAVRERSYHPPENAVREVKSWMVLHGKPSQSPIIQLLFDSFRAPALAGVRSTAVAARQMLYAVGEFRIDLKLERKADTGRLFLAGQALISSDPARPAAGIRVVLLQGSKTVKVQETNEFGEFDLECDAGTRLQLRFVLPRGIEFKVPLPDSSGDSPIAAEKAIDLNRHSEKTKSSKRTRK